MFWFSHYNIINIIERKLVYSERADLFYPFLVADYALLQPWLKEESRLTIPIRPFDPIVLVININ